MEENTEGMGLILSREVQKALISSKITTAQFKTSHVIGQHHQRINLKAVQCYALTNEAAGRGGFL